MMQPPAEGPPLAEKVVVVTGAGGGGEGGIGSAIASRLGAAGARLAVNDLDLGAAEETASEIRATGAEAMGFAADIGDPHAAAEMIEAVVGRFGGIDVLVNNAGIVGVHPVEKTPHDEWRKVLGVNLDGAFYVTREAIPYLRRSRAGRIVFISSIAGSRVGTLGGASYSASKAGLLGFMRHLAAELGRSGITSNAVLPGPVMTPLVARRSSAEAQKEIFDGAPVGRVPVPAEVAEAVLFLAGDGAGFVNGAELTVDGGRSVLPGAFAPWARAAGLAEPEASDPTD